MARIIWTEPALQELDEIADYISLDNPDAAKKLVRKTFKRVGVLVLHPESGKPKEALEGSVYREIVLPPVRIFYRIENDIVYIIHIFKSRHLGILISH